MAPISFSSSSCLETLRFLRRLAVSPRRIGSVLPSSRYLARAMAAELPLGNGAVLELGPGTGVMTREILARGIAPEQLWEVEYDVEFARLLAQNFLGVNVIRGDAFDLDKTLSESAPPIFAGVISGIPLLNYPVDRRRALIAGAFARLKPGAPFVQFSYGLTAPVTPPKGITVHMAAFVWRNMPPARVWVYRKD